MQEHNRGSERDKQEVNIENIHFSRVSSYFLLLIFLK